MQPEIKKPSTRIERGGEGFTHSLYPGYLFGSIESCKQRMDLDGKESTEEPKPSDTRPLIKDVFNTLLAAENEACGTPKQGTFGCAGPWDEYFSVQNRIGATSDSPFPDHGVHLRVDAGSNEGIYLTIRDKQGHVLIIGKTCSSSWDAWQKCHESLARISWMLNAP